MIRDIRLQQFRSYNDESFELAPAVNIIVGPNASGKTNLLEAILVLARGSSYRVKDQQLIAFEQDWCRLESHDDNHTRVVKINALQAPTKAYELDSKTYRRLMLNHTLPVVVFEPNHLLLLTGSPDMRRSYLDDLLEQTISGYGALRRNYRRALSQRNALLKHGAIASEPELFPWNVRLSQLGGQISRYRQEMVAQIAASASELYSALAKHDSDVVVAYESKLPFDNYESSLLKHLENHTEIDRQRGFTSYGPHRDDLQIYLNGQPLQSTASRGETRTAVLMLKITELKLIEQARDQKPLFLLDDVFSELDGARRHALTRYLADYQAFITTTDADVVIQHFTESANIIPLGS